MRGYSDSMEDALWAELHVLISLFSLLVKHYSRVLLRVVSYLSTMDVVRHFSVCKES